MIGGDYLKAVIYCRVAGPENPFAMDAIRGQELELLNYAEKNGIVVTGVYLDVGYSGRTLERPGLRSVMQSVNDGKADTILVTDRCRLFRRFFPKELQRLPVLALKEQNLIKERGGKGYEL